MTKSKKGCKLQPKTVEYKGFKIERTRTCDIKVKRGSVQFFTGLPKEDITAAKNYIDGYTRARKRFGRKRFTRNPWAT